MRSSKLPKESLILSCENETCDRRFANIIGVRTHMARVHGYRKNFEPKIKEDERECTFCKKEFVSLMSLRAHGAAEVCAKRFAKNWKIVNCLACGKINNKYVGRKNGKGSIFCDMKCSSDYQKEKSRIQRAQTKFIQCKGCEILFEVRLPGKQKFHSLDCSQSYSGYRIADSSRMGGPRDGGGHSKVIEYVSRFDETMKLNREEILCAKLLDSSEFRWSRGKTGFPYTSESGAERKFYPDFFVEELNLHIEYKGWLTDAMRHKMKDAQNRNPNLRLLILVGDNSRYLNDGVQLSRIDSSYLNSYSRNL